MTEALIELGEVVAMAKPEAVKSQRITYDELTLVSDAGFDHRVVKVSARQCCLPVYDAGGHLRRRLP